MGFKSVPTQRIRRSLPVTCLCCDWRLTGHEQRATDPRTRAVRRKEHPMTRRSRELADGDIGQNLSKKRCPVSNRERHVTSFRNGGVSEGRSSARASLIHGFNVFVIWFFSACAIDEHRWVRSFVGAAGQTLQRICVGSIVEADSHLD